MSKVQDNGDIIEFREPSSCISDEKQFIFNILYFVVGLVIGWLIGS